MRPYRTCAASSSPLTSLSRTAAQEASLEGMILMPYFLSNSITAAITTDEQSVSGMKPILTSFFSGASEPWAQAPVRTASGTRLIRLVAPAAFKNSRFFIVSPKKKAQADRSADAFVRDGRIVAPGLTSQALCQWGLVDFQ